MCISTTTNWGESSSVCTNSPGIHLYQAIDSRVNHPLYHNLHTDILYFNKQYHSITSKSSELAPGLLSNLLAGCLQLTFSVKELLPKHTDPLQLVYNGHWFAQYFPNTIEEHPLLLYVSALPFTPPNTSIYERFYHKGLPRVICGVEKVWPWQLQLF